jgi:hypothetical protein
MKVSQYLFRLSRHGGLDLKRQDRATSLAAAMDSCMARHSSTCCFKCPKFLCIRSTPMARLSSSEKCLECFAKTGVYTPETI